MFGCGRWRRGRGTNIQVIATHHRKENKTPVAAFQRPSSSGGHPQASCKLSRLWGLLCLSTSVGLQHDCSVQARMQAVLFPFLLLYPLTTLSPGTHDSGCETVNQIMEIFQRIPSSFQLPRDLPALSLPSISDFHLFPSWPHISLNQRLHIPPSAPTQSPQMKTFFV